MTPLVNMEIFIKPGSNTKVVTSLNAAKTVNETRIKGNSSSTYRVFSNLKRLSTLQMVANTTIPETSSQILNFTTKHYLQHLLWSTEYLGLNYDSIPAAKTYVHTTLSPTPVSSINMLPSDNPDTNSSDEGRAKLMTAAALHSETHATSPSLTAATALRSRIGATTTSLGTTMSTGSSATSGHSTIKLLLSLANYRISTAVNRSTIINKGLKDSVQIFEQSGSKPGIFDKPVVVAGVASAAGVITIVSLITLIYKAFAKRATVSPK